MTNVCTMRLFLITKATLLLCHLLLIPQGLAATSPPCKMRMFPDIVLEEQGAVSGTSPHPADIWGTVGVVQGTVQTRLDIYHCLSYNDNKSNQDEMQGIHNRAKTLIIFAADVVAQYSQTNNNTTTNSIATAGAAVTGKDRLTTLATTLAQRGYLVVVADKVNTRRNEASVFLSVDFLRVIQYMESNRWNQFAERLNNNAAATAAVEITNVVLGGHGMGGSMA